MADETGRPDATERPATPWWVKVIGIAVLLVLILAAVIFVVGGGQHGPGMHGSAGTAAPPLGVSSSPTAPYVTGNRHCSPCLFREGAVHS